MGIRDLIKFRLKRGLGIQKIQDQIAEYNQQLREIKNSLVRLGIEQGIQKDDDTDLSSEALKHHIIDLINKSKAGSIFSCCLNHMDLLAPFEMLRMYPHCLHPASEQKLTYFVEIQQSEWLCSKLKIGDVALDIGAAYGIIALAMSQAVGNQGQVHAFEPSRTVQNHFGKILELNSVKNIILNKLAISDEASTAEFIEYTSDNSLSWASDTSTLASDVNPMLENYLKYSVDVTTIDDYVDTTGISPKAIKIDIEGFELYALHGGRNTLEKFLPYLCIDIHQDVRTGKSALLEVEPFLLELGYKVQMEGHALYCTPPKK